MNFGHSEDQIVEDLVAAGEGDRAAFQRIYQATRSRLLAICQNVTRDRAAAEDVLQTVYVKVWRSAARFDRQRARPLTWLGSIARNTAIDWYRSQRPLRQAAEEPVDTIPSASEQADDRMIREEGEDRAIQFVHDLDEELESQVRRIYLEGMTYAETAEADGVPIGTLKSRVRRALITIRSKMRDD